MVQLFFFGVAEGSSKLAIESLAPRKFNIMINYATKVKVVPKNVDKLFIDSGGFSFFFKKKDYSDSALNYLRFVYRKNADFFANRDYPCEPELLRKNNTTVRQNQLRTMENQVKLMDLIDDYYPKLHDKLVAVVQGWTVEEYLWMLDEMKEQGLLTNLIGIGSVCRRGQEKQIREIILALRRNLHRKYKLHGFGVKFSVLKYKDIWDALYSTDSLAYRYGVRKNYVENISIKDQIRENLMKWIENFDSLMRIHSQQAVLEVF